LALSVGSRPTATSSTEGWDGWRAGSLPAVLARMACRTPSDGPASPAMVLCPCPPATGALAATGCSATTGGPPEPSWGNAGAGAKACCAALGGGRFGSVGSGWSNRWGADDDGGCDGMRADGGRAVSRDCPPSPPEP